MAEIIFENLHKIYDNGVVALQGFSLTVADGEFLVLVGPSGCGKSTALRCLAGLETPTSGTISLNGRVINPLPPQDRDLAMVFQNYALYPHMTVFENLSFGLRLRGQSQPEIQQRVQAVAAKLGITHHLPRRPRELSGGERQRVALGRAMVRQPQAFLMDEPLSNLDAALRLKMRTELLQLQRDLGATFVYVTHDQTEAMTMGHRVAVLHQGVLQQVASPLDLYEHPANRFVAGFIGSPAMNFLTGRLSRTAAGLTLTLARQPLPLPADFLEQHPALGDWLEQPLQVGIRPEHFQAAEGPPEGEIRLRVRVAVVETLGAVNYVHFRLADHQDQPDSDGDLFTAALSPQTPVRAGEDLELAVDPVHCHFFEPDSGKVL